MRAHISTYNEVNPLDGVEHSFIELGAWIGDQGLALMMMALGAHLGSWRLVTPSKVLPGMASALLMSMAQQGMVTIMAERGYVEVG